MSYKYEDLTMDDLEARLRHVGSIWFKNDDFLLLEELLRRAQRYKQMLDNLDILPKERN